MKPGAEHTRRLTPPVRLEELIPIRPRHFLPRVEPFAGAKQILRNLVERGHIVLLASSASRDEVARYVEMLEADGLLNGTTSADDVASSKPCPDIFAAALALTGCSAQNAVAIGDTPYDIIAARRAGIDAIAVLSGGFDEDELRSCRPLAIYEDVAELDANYERSPLCDVSSGEPHPRDRDGDGECDHAHSERQSC